MNKYENAIMRATPYILIGMVPLAFLTGMWYEQNEGEVRACHVLFTFGGEREAASFNASDWDAFGDWYCSNRGEHDAYKSFN